MCIFVTRNLSDYKCKIMINRINLILRAKNITARQFAEEIGIQPSGMSHIMGGRNNPSLDFVTKVIRRYPEIDANWLLLGRGEMYTSGNVPVAAMPPDVHEHQPEPEPETTVVEEHKPEPTLFAIDDEEPAPLPKVEETAYRPTYVAVPPEEVQQAANVESDTRRVARMLLIYSDHTFEEYAPRR